MRDGLIFGFMAGLIIGGFLSQRGPAPKSFLIGAPIVAAVWGLIRLLP